MAIVQSRNDWTLAAAEIIVDFLLVAPFGKVVCRQSCLYIVIISPFLHNLCSISAACHGEYNNSANIHINTTSI